MGRRDLRRKRKKIREKMRLRQAEGVAAALLRQRLLEQENTEFCTEEPPVATIDDEDGGCCVELAGPQSLE